MFDPFEPGLTSRNLGHSSRVEEPQGSSKTNLTMKGARRVVEADKTYTEKVGIRTAILLGKLSAFAVTEADLKNECRNGYLPHPEIVSRGGQEGSYGLWSPMSVTRAKRLYRLRKCGLTGKTLKLFLFIKDGWGWEDIRDTCATGVERISAVSLNGVKRYAPTEGTLDCSLDDIGEFQNDILLKKVGHDSAIQATSRETLGFTVGVLHDGVPLEGGSSRRLLEPIVKSLTPTAGEWQINLAAFLLDIVVGFLDLRASRMTSRVRIATPKQVEHARKQMTFYVYLIRKMLRGLPGAKTKGARSNPLTFFGHGKKIEPSMVSQGDIRVTSTLMLAGFIGWFIALYVATDEFVAMLTRQFIVRRMHALAVADDGKK
jgi:hypothetical protein